MAARPYLTDYVGLLQASEACLIDCWEKLRNAHPLTPDIGQQSALFMTSASLTHWMADKFCRAHQ
jgi:hypothetical protein